ncbi:hypothetical protein ACFQ7F_22890 [Streptomyces sp. NPDC056486]|uniref:hypothetical protein n=1 Tax=Streptomyces sp. NPDC056486 TaxID=3345835 RepID=UPI0036901900
MKGAVPTQEGAAPFAVCAICADSGSDIGIDIDLGIDVAVHNIAVCKHAVRDVRMPYVLYVRSVTGAL